MLSQVSIRRWHWVHKWTSLVCTLFALLLCLTGLPLIFSDEIGHALGHAADPPPLPETTRRADADAIVADAKTRRPGDAVQFLVADPGEPDLWFVRLGVTADAPSPSAFYAYDARTGQFLREHPLREGVMNMLLRLHVDLFAGLPGMLFLGCMGVLLALSLVSGAVLYGVHMRKLRFGTVRRNRSARVEWLDLHNLLGIATLVWFLAVTVTGVINTLATPIFNRWQSTELAEMTASYRGKPPLAGGVSAQRALDAARLAEPSMALGFMAFPGSNFAGPHHFVAFMQGSTPLTSKLLKPLLIDAQSGRLVEKRELPGYVNALLVSKPLHFGDYGGLPLKALWALLDVLSIVVLGSGLYLWVKKRHVPFEARLGVPANETAALPLCPEKRADAA